MFYKVIQTRPINTLASRQLSIIQKCINEAEKSDFNDNRRLSACVIIKNKQYYGSNKTRTRFEGKNVFSVHAEVQTVNNVLKSNFRKGVNNSKDRLNGTLYVIRILRNKDNMDKCRTHKLAISKPCINCQIELYKRNICTVYYTDVINNVEVLVKMKKI